VARDELKGHDAERPGVERSVSSARERAASSVYGPNKVRTRTRPVAASRTPRGLGRHTKALENLSPK
jgi:hypothetical protein